MSLQIPSYPDPHDSANPATQAYAFIGFEALDFTGESPRGRVVLPVYRSSAAALAGDKPIDDRTYMITPEDFAAAMADPDFASAFQVFRQTLFDLARIKVPEFADAIDVP